MASLNAKAKELYAIQKTLARSTAELADFKDYSAYNSERNVMLLIKVKNNQTINEMMCLSEAMAYFITSAFNIAKLGVDDDLYADSSFYYILGNGNDAILEAVDNASDFFSKVFSFS